MQISSNNPISQTNSRLRHMHLMQKVDVMLVPYTLAIVNHVNHS